ncbi:MAG: rane-bound lytic murein transglycosylase [Hydrocarboniphaga sp.]|nr:membrane-bound lytic murein transglycosylase MltF [Hydrocarboniphaga sp.]MDB5971957.1 rane-bound lytic murein transglycosylase [Hydrocarboniphaga sp.]
MVGVAACCALTTCTPSVSSLEKVRKTGVLRVATVNSPTTYYQGPDGPTGFEYDLAQGLADKLGVELQIEVAASPPAALDMVRSGQVDVAAASLGVTALRGQHVRFSRPVLTVVPQLVYRMGTTQPENLGGLGGRLVVPAGSSQAEQLASLHAHNPGLVWQESGDDDSEDLLEKVASGEIDYTVANSDLIAINQRYYPKLRVAFALADSQDLAWAFSQDRDPSLFDAAGEYLNSIGDTELARLRDRHFGHIEQVDTLGAVALATHAQTRLPRYRAAFEKAARKYGLDWRLLAAISYQESHWDPAAVSPTGVRGIMQLTAQTALHLKVADREDPLQSIGGGAMYLRTIIDQLPEEVAEPDRTWLALVAYNMGVAHLNDVRDLTSSLGGDGTRWLDVRGSLPLLGQPKWYKQTRHGYARGRQAMQFVGNVRTYYDMLVWLTDGSNGSTRNVPQGVLMTPAIAPPEDLMPSAEQILKIRSPIL